MDSGTDNGWIELRVDLKNKHGLHMRPAQRIVETAGKFRSEVRVIKDEQNLSAKSILDMIEFAAYMVNKAARDDHEFTIRARGPDAQAALKALEQLVETRFGLD